MRRVVSEVAEERLVAFRADELQCGVGQHISDEAFRLHDAPILFEPGVEIVVPMPKVEPEAFVKTLPVRRVGVMLSVVPFAEESRAVTSGAQGFGNRHLFGPHRLLPFGDAADADPQRITPGQQRSARRGAKWADEETVETDALAP